MGGVAAGGVVVVLAAVSPWVPDTSVPFRAKLSAGFGRRHFNSQSIVLSDESDCKKQCSCVKTIQSVIAEVGDVASGTSVAIFGGADGQISAHRVNVKTAKRLLKLCFHESWRSVPSVILSVSFSDSEKTD